MPECSEPVSPLVAAIDEAEALIDKRAPELVGSAHPPHAAEMTVIQHLAARRILRIANGNQQRAVVMLAKFEQMLEECIFHG